MLSKHKRNQFIQHIEAASLQLSELPPQHALEARYSFYKMKQLLLSAASDHAWEHFFAARAERIACSDNHYFHDLTNSANRICVDLAKNIFGAPYLPFLIPRLREVPVAQYITSSYQEEDPDFSQLILADEQNRLIHCRDVMDFALEDGTLKHNSLFGDSTRAKPLSLSEIKKLLSRHSTVSAAFLALQTLLDYKHAEETIGAALRKLSTGLQDGGASRVGGDEYDAGPKANIAIADFSDYLETLSEATRIRLMTAHREGVYFAGERINLTIEILWQELKIVFNQDKPDEYRGVSHCVDQIGKRIDEIVAENGWLYDVFSYESDNHPQLDELTLDYVKKQKSMASALPTVQQHRYYGEAGDHSLCHKLLLDMAADAPDFVLYPSEISYFIQLHLMLKKYSAAQVLNKKVSELLSSIKTTYPEKKVREALEMVSEDERQAFASLNSLQNRVSHRTSSQRFYAAYESRKRKAPTEGADQSDIPAP